MSGKNASLSRRQMLKIAGTLSVGTALAACGATPTPTKVPPTATKPPAAGPTQAPAPATATKPAAAPTQAPAATPKPAAMPDVYLWVDQGLLRNAPEGSPKEKREQVADIIRQKIGVNPIPVYSPVGTAATEKLNMLLASQSDRLDIWTGQWYDYADVVVQVNDLVEQNGANIKQWVNTPQRWLPAEDNQGKRWGVPRSALMNRQVPWVRQDWLDKLSLKAPKTIDELEQVMAAFEKMNPAQAATMSSLTDVLQSTLGAFTEHGNGRWRDPKDNRIKHPVQQAGFKDWVVKLNDWNKKGYLFGESLGVHDYRELLRQGVVGAHLGWDSNITLGVPEVQANQPEMKFTSIQDMTGPKGYAKTIRSGNASGCTLISKKCPNPAAAMKMIDYVFVPEQYLMAWLGPRGVTWDWVGPASNNHYKVTDSAWGYVGEFRLTFYDPLAVIFIAEDPRTAMHNNYAREYMAKTDSAKIPFDAWVSYPTKMLTAVFPGVGDIDRLFSEETIKFILGTRDLKEWDAFMKQLNDAGIEKWSDAYTKVYTQMAKA